MASIVKDPGGKKRLQYTDPSSGKKSTIRLGKLEVRQAETVRTKVESLLSASITGALDAETSKWVAGIDDRLHRKLAAKGLVPPRTRSGHTLGALLDEYFRTVEVKASTAVTYKQTRRSLEEHFGATKNLKLITPLEADRWRGALRDEGLAEATVSKRVKTARQVFKQGLRWKMVPENPFTDVKAGAQTNKERMCYIGREIIERVLEACPDGEWRLIVALSRFGGLRCPSEHLALRWDDVDWDRGRLTVRSPKTEGMEGREFRHVPLFPELKLHLLEQFERAAPGAEFVVTRARSSSTNLRTGLLRIIARAGVSPWPRLFHNLRASRQTELVESFPLHVVCAWLGNTPAIAQGHYLQVHDAHFEKAAGEGSAGVAPAKATQKATPHAAEWARTEPQSPHRASA
jgi:integrase